MIEEFRAGETQGPRDKAEQALLELGHSPSASKVVEGLVGLLADADENVRWRVAYALGVGPTLLRQRPLTVTVA
ncbi:MAG: hypothetical protein WBW48_14875 [Anaerolineae bacterium]